jgi:hypothetical protein
MTMPRRDQRPAGATSRHDRPSSGQSPAWCWRVQMVQGFYLIPATTAEDARRRVLAPYSRGAEPRTVTRHVPGPWPPSCACGRPLPQCGVRAGYLDVLNW